MINVDYYKLSPRARMFGFTFSNANKFLEIDLWYVQIYIFWGEE